MILTLFLSSVGLELQFFWNILFYFSNSPPQLIFLFTVVAYSLFSFFPGYLLFQYFVKIVFCNHKQFNFVKFFVFLVVICSVNEL